MNKGAIIACVRESTDLDFVCPQYHGHTHPPFVLWDTIRIPSQMTKQPTEVDVIVLTRTGAEIIERPLDANKLIIEAARWAVEERHARVIGLTSVTSSVTLMGTTLTGEISDKVVITHGDSLASIVAREQIDSASRLMGHPLEEMTVAVVGAYGLIGSYVSAKLSKRCKKLILIGRNPYKLGRLHRELPTPPDGPTTVVETNTGISAAVEADIIVTATSSPSSLLTIDLLRPRKDKPLIVIDVSVPPNLHPAEYQRVITEMPLAVRIDGAIVSIPSINMGKIQITGVKPGTIFACWAETILQTGQNEEHDHIGPIKDDYADVTYRWMRRYGFDIANPTCFGEPISTEIFKKLSG